jgi:hypothetical protein
MLKKVIFVLKRAYVFWKDKFQCYIIILSSLTSATDALVGNGCI